MPAAERDKEGSEKERSVGSKPGFIKEGESFVRYIQRVNNLENSDGNPSLAKQVLESSQFCQLLGYVKWQNREASVFAKRNLLAPLVQHVLLPKTVDTYDYIERTWMLEKGAETERKTIFRSEQMSMAWRHVGIKVTRPNYSENELEILSEFLTHCAIDDLEDQMLNGKGTGKGGCEELKGLLKQGCLLEGKANLVETCEHALEEFHKRLGRPPSVIVMSFPQKLRLMKTLCDKSPGMIATTFASLHSHFASIPIAVSDFMPNENIMLAQLDSVCLFSKELHNIHHIDYKIDHIAFSYNYWCNIAIKEKHAVMTVNLPDDCLKN